MKSIFSFIILIILCSYFIGCASVNINRFMSDHSIENKIPAKLEIDKESFKIERIVDNRRKKLIEKNKPLIDEYLEKNPYIDTTSLYNSLVDIPKIDPRQTKEIINFIKKELIKNILYSESIKHGYIICHLVNRETKTGAGWFFAGSSLLTCFIPNLLGYPLISQTTKLEIEIEILDFNRNLISKYTVFGKGTAYCAMFWGYNMVDAANSYNYAAVPRASYLLALHRAMYDLKKQIQLDAIMIRDVILH